MKKSTKYRLKLALAKTVLALGLTVGRLLSFPFVALYGLAFIAFACFNASLWYLVSPLWNLFCDFRTLYSWSVSKLKWARKYNNLDRYFRPIYLLNEVLDSENYGHNLKTDIYHRL